MDVYADYMMSYLPRHAPRDLSIIPYTPRVSRCANALPEIFNTRMRFARYISYPLQAKGVKAVLHHIIEHGYVHLVETLNPVKTVVTVHDLIPILAWKGLIRGLTYNHAPRVLNTILRRCLNRVGCIIAISERTKQDLVTHMGCHPEKITVIYYGIGEQFSPVCQDTQFALRQSLGLPKKDVPLVLVTGETLYKNHAAAVQAIKVAEQKLGQSVQLIRLGRPYPEWETYLSKTKLSRRVIEFESLPLYRVADLYRAVDCLLFPSLYEGFGRPPLESMACGTPVVASTAASLPEVVGGAGLMADPHDVEGLGVAVAKVLSEEPVRRDLIARGFENIKRFDWNTNATKTLATYDQLLCRG